MATAFELLVQDIQTRLNAVFLRKTDRNPGRHAIAEATKIPWSWIAVNTASILSEYPTGLTKVVLLSILELNWERTFLKRYKGFDKNFNESSAREMDIYLHPKFSNWISYLDHEFFLNRKMRMMCPPKTNSPITTRYDDKTLARKYRIALIPPTELLIFILTRFDKEFVQREFPDKIRDISNKLNYNFWLKIIHVEIISHTSTTVSIDSNPKLNRTDIYLMDMTSENQPVILSLYDQQASLSPIFKRNDYIGLYHPTIQSPRADVQEIVFEYSSETVIFLMPEKEAQDAGLAKINLTSMVDQSESEICSSSKKDIIKRDEEGFMDCEGYVPRVNVTDMNYCMLNVTLFGKVIGLANNNPYNDPNNANHKMDRYALRIADSTGTMDITLWEYSGRDSRKIRAGQYILLDKLVTSDKHESGNKRVWYVNGSVILGTKMYNISTLSSLLTSHEFCNIVPLWHSKEMKMDHFQVEGTITGWEFYLKTQAQFVLSSNNTTTNTDIDFMDLSIGDRITATAHLGCLNPHKKINQKECEFCGCQINNQVAQVFRPKPTVADTTFERGWEGWVEWILDDGTSTCKVYGGEEAFQLYAHLLEQVHQLTEWIK
ncbi:hypothetical protein INT48_004986 [Thamnidium elegans]|uniref:Uncharacterized protein n=1 Tax=Thamnidium elegans TaxID=101142 RepID=A0A8H7SUA2_9FUNG|nr:hypothetical protein INT48_004986 [Thamnidium elegans]